MGRWRIGLLGVYVLKSYTYNGIRAALKKNKKTTQIVVFLFLENFKILMRSIKFNLVVS